MKFEPAPIFVNLPYATTGLGGRRWRMWQSQLGSIGKVYPIILPEGLSDPGQCTSLKEVAEQMFTSSLTRVQEVGGTQVCVCVCVCVRWERKEGGNVMVIFLEEVSPPKLNL